MNLRAGLAAWSFVALATGGFGSDFGRIMCLGDSLTGSGGDTYAYREQLYNRLRSLGDQFNFVGPIDQGNFPGQSDHQSLHAGFSEYRAIDLWNGHPSHPENGKLADWLPPAHPDTVVFMAGTNDVWDVWSVSGGSWGSAAQARLETIMPQRYNGILSQIFAQNPSMRVVFMAPPKVLNTSLGDFYKTYMEKLSAVVKTVADQWKATGKDIRFVDMWAATSYVQDRDIGPDQVHWSTGGMANCARHVLEALHLPMSPGYTGKVSDSRFGGDWSTVGLRYKVTDFFGTVLATGPLTVTPSGEFKVDSPATGNQALTIYGSHWLRRFLPRTMPTTGVWLDLITLTNGDIDGDNAITVFDYSILSNHWDANSSDANWNVADADGFRPRDADLDGDGTVSVFDYSILGDNFDQVGQ